MEIEGSLLVVGLCLVSVIALESNENTAAFLEKLKEALQGFTNLDLNSYEGQVILKDKFLSQCVPDIRIKLQQLQQRDPAASLDEMVQTASHIFYNRTGEGSQGPGKGEKKRHKACQDAICPPGKTYHKPQLLEG